MAIAYNSPGVTVSETVNPALAPLLANPSIVAVVGAARGEQSASERLLLADASTTISTATGALPVATLTVASTEDFRSSGALVLSNADGTGSVILGYTGKTATTFTGVTGGTGTFSAGALVTQPKAINLKYTGVQTSSLTVADANSGITTSPGAYAVAAGADPDASVAGDEPYTLTRIIQPVAAPTVSAAGTGTLTGTYEFAYSFVSAAGETGIGPASTGVAIAGAGYNLSNIAVGPTGTTSRVIYRRKVAGTGGDNVWRLVSNIADNAGTTVTNETTTDLAASSNAQPKNGLTRDATVIASYDYTDNNYYEPTLFSDFDDIVQKYGPPFDANGNISSALTFAARLVFLNGASELIAVAANGTSSAAIEAALAELENEPDVRIVVAAGGTAATSTAVTAHVAKMNAHGFYRFGVVGQDGTGTTVLASALRASAQGLNTESIRMVSPSSFRMQNPITGRPLNVGGQYMAAALAGMYAARDIQVPLTRKSVAGFDGVNDKRTASELGLDSTAGLLVIEDRGGVLRVRHDITTAVGSVNTRESSVVRAKYEMASRLKYTLDSAVVGTVTTPDRAPLIVEGVVSAVLGQLQVEQAIAAYNDVKARVLSGDPTTVEVRFGYTPMYPINNIAVVFTINTLTGEFGLT